MLTHPWCSEYDMKKNYICAVCARAPDQKASYGSIFFKESSELMYVHYRLRGGGEEETNPDSVSI